MQQRIALFSMTGERRGRGVDRRQTPRGGRRLSDKLRLALFTAACAAVTMPATASAQVKFGFDADSIPRARQLGMPVAYASAWAGPWNQKWGWKDVERQLHAAKDAGVVPVVQWWYWGDDISPSCVERGCTDRYEGVWKDKAAWTRLSNELADLIVNVMGPGSNALVITETEFNKNGIEDYEPFDGYLADQAAIFHARQLKVVLGFGNWGRSQWRNFDRAVAAADVLGTQILRSSVRDATTYLSGADMLLQGALYNQQTFGKPTFITDFAFSSYPEPSYLNDQDTVVRDVFARMDEFRAAGVQGMIWRMLADDPAFDTNNYHGEAERHWGLLHADGSAKPAFTPFLNGMLTEKAYAEAIEAAAAAAAVDAAQQAAAAQAAAAQAIQAPAIYAKVSGEVPARRRGDKVAVGRAVARPAMH
jgi:hypothetical protein